MTPPRERRLAGAVIVMALVALTGLPSRAVDQPPESSCIKCHLLLADQLKAVAEAFKDDVHNQPRLGCPACHGGNPEA